MSNPTPRAVLRQLDAIAIDQLCAEVARLAVENERLRVELAWAEDAADSWRDDALRIQEQLCEQTGARPGITIDGELVVMQGDAP